MFCHAESRFRLACEKARINQFWSARKIARQLAIDRETVGRYPRPRARLLSAGIELRGAGLRPRYERE